MRRAASAGSLLLLLLLILVPAAAMPRPAAALDAGDWLDDPSIVVNRPGDAIPTPPEGMYPPMDPCRPYIRPAETDADRQIEAAGWFLVQAYEAGWGVTMIEAAAGFDAMCRFSPYMVFLFVDGVYAGTVTPVQTWPRGDGALASASLGAGGAVFATYLRYDEADPLCCPREMIRVAFAAERTPDGPVMLPGERTRLDPETLRPLETGASPSPSPSPTP